MPPHDRLDRVHVEPDTPMDVNIHHPTNDSSIIGQPMVIDQPPQATQHYAASTGTTGRPQRNRRLPARYRDEILRLAPPALVSPPDPDPDPIPRLPRVFLIVQDGLKTLLGSFGLWRHYAHRPSYDPDSIVPNDDLAESDTNHTSGNLRPTHPGPP